MLDKVTTDQRSIDPEIAVRLSVKATSENAGPDGNVPSLLLFGSLPYFPAVNMDVPVQKERTAAL